jgi:hypothetical protein
MTELSSAELRAIFARKPFGLLSCLSFEERSITVATELAACGLKRWFCLANEDIEADVSDIRQRAVKIAADAGIQIEFLTVSKRAPLLLADAMVQINRLISEGQDLCWIADVTTMTHEMALVTVAAAEDLVRAWQDISFVYNVAGRYFGDDKPEERWISRGILEVRSVVGYPGSWSPGEPTVMVALPGFDPERVQRIIEDIEPERLLVGIALPAPERHTWSADRNREIAVELLGTRDGTTFEYPALDPIGAADAIINIVGSINCNVLLAPFNSKISTVALGLLARARPEWQVCYAPALVYNIRYATPSDCFLTITLQNMRTHIRSALKAAATRQDG